VSFLQPSPHHFRGRQSRRALDVSEVSTTLSVHLDMVERDATVVTLEGELDISTAALLEAMLTSLLGGGVRHVVIAARRLRFCDVRGFRVLADAHTVLTAAGSGLAIAEPTPVLHLLARLMRQFPAGPSVTPIPMYTTVADALRGRTDETASCGEPG
jgi:stage II sporulation protein AA (anti-sigma F factor antagonist)